MVHMVRDPLGAHHMHHSIQSKTSKKFHKEGSDGG